MFENRVLSGIYGPETSSNRGGGGECIIMRNNFIIYVIHQILLLGEIHSMDGEMRN
jgi:hypothetical protein